MRSRPVGFGLFFLALCVAGNAGYASENKPTIVVALGMMPEQVLQRSTFPVKWSLIPIGQKQRRGGGTLVIAPHRLIYEDATLRLVLPDAGNHISMPTAVMVAFDAVNLVSASVLGEYVSLGKAIESSRSLLAEVLAQGFEYAPHHPEKRQGSKFVLARRNTGAAPRTVGNFEEMEQVFLNSRYYLEEFLVFVLVKSDVRVSLRVTNMRRRHTESRISLSEPNKTIPERAAREAENFDEAFLRNERAYYLEVSIVDRELRVPP
jgi:hypothetical protein